MGRGTSLRSWLMEGAATGGGGGGSLPPDVDLGSLIAAFIPSGYNEGTGAWVDTSGTYTMTQPTSSARPVSEDSRVKYLGNDYHILPANLLTALSGLTALSTVRICTAGSASQYYFIDLIGTSLSHRVFRSGTTSRSMTIDWNSGGGGVTLSVADIADTMQCRTEVANRNSAMLSGQGATWSSGSTIANETSPAFSSGYFGSFAGSSNFMLAEVGGFFLYGAALTQAQHNAIRTACSDNATFGTVGVTL